jgi:hypothetical protein
VAGWDATGAGEMPVRVAGWDGMGAVRL